VHWHVHCSRTQSVPKGDEIHWEEKVDKCLVMEDQFVHDDTEGAVVPAGFVVDDVWCIVIGGGSHYEGDGDGVVLSPDLWWLYHNVSL